ncbi:MAG TPA: ATP synthase F1 subunit gamma [Chloroflexota bacterium]|nr:ATP synthase F1 subunit gamma [Chloroflexota bacterium]
MATAREIRRRMNSIRNIGQITRAMELIAVTRLRRAQQRVLASRPYADKMRDVLGEVVERVGGPATDVDTSDGETVALHPLLERRATVERVGVVVLTTDRGLCGALNANVIRAALQFTYEQQNQGRAVDMIVVGRKGLLSLRRQPVNIIAEFTGLGDYPDISRVMPIARLAMDAFTSHQMDEVVFVYPRYVSTMRQDPTVVPLLPIQPPERAEESGSRVAETEYIYEPSPPEVLAALLPRFVEMQVYQAVLELIASEFSARMVAMRNASDNAKELLNDLRLGYNKARQATITREIIEVASGAAAER